MANTTLNKVVVNKLTKSKYDQNVQSGTITPTMQREQVWLFTDDQYVSQQDKTNWDNKADSSAIPTKTSDLTNDSGFITNADVPSKTSDLTNDSGFITSADIPTDVSAFTNDAGYITTETDPTVPSWAKEPTKPTYTKAEVGLGNVDNKSSETIRSEITSSNITNALGFTPMDSALKGTSNGVAELDNTGKVPSSQLPSYVDDVVEGYFYNDKFWEDSSHTIEIPASSGKIYVDVSTDITYRWGGSAYVAIGSSLTLGETSTTAYRGDRGKIAYDHSQSPHAPANAEANTIDTISVNNTAITPDANKNVDITVPTATSDLLNDSGFITTETDPVFTASAAHGISSSDITNWNAKASTSDIKDGTLTITNNNTTLGTFTANQSSNTTIDLSVPTKTSDLVNDSHFVTSSDDSLPNIVELTYEEYKQLETNNLLDPNTEYHIAEDSSQGITEEDPIFTSSPAYTITNQDITNWNGKQQPMVILSYGHSTWNDFITAFNNNAIVYCKASMGSDPAVGAQKRYAFMACISIPYSTIESVEFQYYRSVSSHSDSQQGDQVYIYTLSKENGGTWSCSTREAYTKVVAGTNMSSTYSNGTITLNSTASGGSWGTITGTLSNQTDLANALNNKADTSSIPTKVSDLNNDSGFITNTVNNLTNYYTTDNTYTKTEVNNLISQIDEFKVEIVQTLPISDIDPHTIYLVPKTGSSPDVYDEYIYVNNSWELIGNTAVDLSNYYTKSETNTLLNTKANTSDVPTKTSDLNNDSGFITKSVSDLTYYYDKTSIDTTVNSLYDALSSDIAPSYDNTATYSIGDYVNWLGYLYVCTTNISVPEDFDLTHWSAVDVTSLLDTKENSSNKVTSISSASTNDQYPSAKCVYDSIPTTTSDLTNNSGFITSSDVPTKTSDLTNDSGYMTGLTELSYGHSTWNDFITAYNAKHIVYCKASSSTNPASGTQTRKAFMAYVNNDANPTNVEFQYVRSIASHSASQQGDQVFVYKLDKTAGWTVTTREMSTKVVAGTGLTSSYSSGTLTLKCENNEVTTNKVTSLSSSSTNTQYPSAKCVYDGLATKQDSLVSGTNIKTINNSSLLGSGDIEVAANIPVQDTAPSNPSAGDLWVDTSETGGSEYQLDYYSETETKTNKVWIDGEPIYRKVIITQQLTSDLGTQVVFTLATNINNLIFASASTQSTNHIRQLPIPGAAPLSADWDLDRTDHSVYLTVSRNDANSYSTAVLVCIIEYTKTTT